MLSIKNMQCRNNKNQKKFFFKSSSKKILERFGFFPQNTT